MAANEPTLHPISQDVEIKSAFGPINAKLDADPELAAGSAAPPIPLTLGSDSLDKKLDGK